MNVYHIGYFETKEKEDLKEFSSMRIIATDEMHAEMKFRYAVGDKAKFVYKIDEKHLPTCNNFPKCKLIMKHKSILEAVEWHLNRYGSITQLQCLAKFGSWRLSHYIYALKKRGLNIESKSLKVKTRFGAVTNVAKYILIK